MRGFSVWLLLVVFTVVVSISQALDTGWKAAQKADRVVRLPGQPRVKFDMYAGYITVDEDHGRAQFYIFVEAAEEPEKKPLVIWLTGGPGCSSICFGFAALMGPFFINPGGEKLRLNPNSGNIVANIIYVESPAGTGFSYTNTSSDLLTSGDNRTAYDNFAFVVNWLERFPQYKGRPLYITGESYAGYYVPELSKLIFDNNKNLPDKEKINFKGFMVGNAVIDSYYDNVGKADYLYHHAMISDDLYNQIKQVCNFAQPGNWTLSDACIQILYYDTAVEYGLIDAYSIYAPTCTSYSENSSVGNATFNYASKTPLFKPELRRFAGEDYDPCTYYYTIDYFNRPDVQEAIHANTTGIPYPWVGCTDIFTSTWNRSTTTVLPIYEEFLAAGLRLWVYSGDADSIVAVTGNRYALTSLELPTVVPWFSWYNKDQVGGREIVYEGNLTFVTIRGGGHEAGLLRPREFLQVLGSFLNGSLLPRESYT